FHHADHRELAAMNARTLTVKMLAALLAVLTLVVVTVAPATAADDDKGWLGLTYGDWRKHADDKYRNTKLDFYAKGLLVGNVQAQFLSNNMTCPQFSANMLEATLLTT